MLAIQFLGWADFARALVQIVPPVVAAVFHDDGAAGALEHDYVLDAGAFGERFIHRILEAHFLAAPP